ncbi:hypothetical protein [Bosea sp. RAC05]|uniref:hypothetical protein n=1 Tax=Bosea sp. RAC05 TaxID=1842539 RepID=UPI000855FE4D|nr:hypothetical protein [Bosea sp. RAC05]AOG02945.1 hypothetical protein BSY19_5392 [Bosea sp. RAC05]
MDDQPVSDGEAAISYLRQPFENFPAGAFFSEKARALPLAKDTEFEAMGYGATPLLMRARHLPTTEIIALVGKAYGDRATRLCEDWRRLWHELVDDVDEFARIVGYQPTPSQPFPVDALDRCRSRIAAGRAQSSDANLIEAAGRFSAEQARSREQHILEDAKVALALAGRGLHFALFIHSTKQSWIVGRNAIGQRTKRRLSKKAEAEVQEGYRQVNPYWTLPSFLATASRTILEVLGTRHLGAVLADMAKLGHSLAFLKDCRLKGGTWVIDLAGVHCPDDALKACLAAMGMSFIRLVERGAVDDRKARFLVQEFRPFRSEHRFFCVAGRIVASTASHRGSTILDAHAMRLDPHVAVLDQPAAGPGPYDRGSSKLVEDRALVARMTRLVRKFLRSMREDECALTALPDNFVIDVGSNGDMIDLIEINTFRNAGLYGVNYDRIADALAGDLHWRDDRKALRLRLTRMLEEVGFSAETSRSAGQGQGGWTWVTTQLPVSSTQSSIRK